MIKNILKDEKGQISQIFLIIMLLALTAVALARWIIPAFGLIGQSQDDIAKTKILDLQRTYGQADLGPISITGNAIKNEMDTIVRNTFQNNVDRWTFNIKLNGSTTIVNTGDNTNGNKSKYEIQNMTAASGNSMQATISNLINDTYKEKIFVKTIDVSAHIINYTEL